MRVLSTILAAAAGFACVLSASASNLRSSENPADVSYVYGVDADGDISTSTFQCLRNAGNSCVDFIHRI